MIRALLVFLLVMLVVPSAFAGRAAPLPISHVIVIVEENHTFDNYFGTYPGANGIAGAKPQPVAPNSTTVVKPYMINTTTVSQNPCENWECAHKAYDNGKMDGFYLTSNNSLPMGYFNPSLISYYWDYASQFVLLDNFYTSVMSNSLSNHLYLISGQSGGLTQDERFQVINFTSSTVHNNEFYFKSIVDEMDANHISWKYYAGGYTYLNNWNPLPAFASMINNQTRLANLADPQTFLTDVSANRLPTVSWIMPVDDVTSEHAPYNITAGQRWVVSEVNAVMSSSYWNSTAIFVTWDDWGGWYDHVPPPQVDQLGYGMRVPCLIISPFAKQGYVDHTQGDFTSILKFIETTYSLQPLADRDGAANNLMEAFDPLQSPRSPLVLPGPFVPNHYPLTFPNGTLYGGGRPSAYTSTEVSTTTKTSTLTSTLSPPTVTSTKVVTTEGTVTSTNVVTTQAAAPASSLELLYYLVAFSLGGLATFFISRRRRTPT